MKTNALKMVIEIHGTGGGVEPTCPRFTINDYEQSDNLIIESHYIITYFSSCLYRWSSVMSAIEQNQEIVVDTTLERPASPSLDLSDEGQEFQGF